MPVLLLLAVAAAAAVPVAGAGFRVPHWQPQWPWPQPDDPQEKIDSQWARTLEALWATTHEHLGFCIGSSQRRAQARATAGWSMARCLACSSCQLTNLQGATCASGALLQRLVALSFPWPLPASNDTADAICSNSTRMDLHLCSPPEIELYYKVHMLAANGVMQHGLCADARSAHAGARHEHRLQNVTLQCPAVPPCLATPLQYMLLTENPEKVPDNQHCSAGSEGQPACSPGFFDAVRGGRAFERSCASLPRARHKLQVQRHTRL